MKVDIEIVCKKIDDALDTYSRTGYITAIDMNSIFEASGMDARVEPGSGNPLHACAAVLLQLSKLKAKGEI